MKEHGKIPEEELSEVEIGLYLKMIKELRRRMDAQTEKVETFHKELENIKNNQR